MNTIKKYGVLPFGIALYVVLVLRLTGLVPEWGRWYLESWQHRAQVAALLQGRFALSNDLLSLDHDLVWSEGGVHQVWGLGVPFWQLPFTAAARLFGVAHFPEMIAFGIALGLAGWLVVRSLADRTHAPAAALRVPSAGWMVPFGAALIFLLFPPFIGLLHTQFVIYEEAIAYEYVYGLVLLGAMVLLARRPSPAAYYGACLLAGVGGFIRPTLIMHGAATVITGGIVLAQGNPPGERRDAVPAGSRAILLPVLIGCCLYAAGIGLLFASNRVRFGKGLEFGFNLTVSGSSGVLYTTRFDAPFQTEPLLSAAGELATMLFRSPVFNDYDYFRPHFFSGQSDTIRWRELYISAYDLSYAFLMAGGLIAGFARAKPVSGGTPSGSRDRTPLALAAWGGFSLLFLTGFYVRLPVISSRYLLDFMPAVAALIAALWIAVGSRCLRTSRSAFLVPLLLVGLCGWLTAQIAGTHCLRGNPRLLRGDELVPHSALAVSGKELRLPTRYEITEGNDPILEIPFNGQGWSGERGQVQPCVTLFVQDPAFLEIEVASDEAVPAETDLPIRAKIGLERLSREAVVRSGDSWRVRFRGPRSARFKYGIQPVFLAFGPNTRLADPVTSWRLLSVHWQ